MPLLILVDCSDNLFASILSLLGQCRAAMISGLRLEFGVWRQTKVVYPGERDHRFIECCSFIMATSCFLIFYDASEFFVALVNII